MGARVRRAAALALFGLLIVLAVPARGSAGAASPGQGLAVRFSGVSDAHLDRALKGRTAPDVTVQRSAASAAAFVDPLRLRLIPARVLAVASDPTACLPAVSVSALLEEASREIDFVELESAARLLARARLAIACGPLLVPVGELGRLLFLEAVLRIELGQAPGTRMQDALAVDPALPVPSAYSAGVLEAFEAAHRARASAARRPVRIRRDGLEGLVLAIDGQAIAASELELSEGSHFLQLLTPDGRALAAAEVRLEPSAAAAPIWPPAELLPPGGAETVERLERGLSAGRLDAAVVGALAGLLRDGPYRWIGLVTAGPEDGQGRQLRTAWIDAQGAVELASIAVPAGSSRSRTSLYAALGLGAVSLLGGGAAGYTYRLGTTTLFPDTIAGHADAEQLLVGNRVANGVWAAGLTGTAVSIVAPFVFGGRGAKTAAIPPPATDGVSVALSSGGLTVAW